MTRERAKPGAVRDLAPPLHPNGRVLVTERASPTIRTIQGWLLPLEHYDESLRLNPTQQYLELLLLMSSKRPVDRLSMATVLRQARNSLSDEEYDRLVSFRPMFDPGRLLPP